MTRKDIIWTADLDALRENFNSTSPEEVARYVDAGNLTAAGELLSGEALIHEACGNASRAEAFYALADRLGDLVVQG